MTVIAETERALRAEVAALTVRLHAAESKPPLTDAYANVSRKAREEVSREVAALKAERDALIEKLSRASNILSAVHPSWTGGLKTVGWAMRVAENARDFVAELASPAAPAALPAPTKEPIP